MFNTDNLVRYHPRSISPLHKPPSSRKPNENILVYQNLNVIRRLSKAKFPVYLTTSKFNNQSYAMKLFGPKDNKPHPYYKNEVRFASLEHPNIIRIVHYENEKDTLYKGELKRVSYILMEYAPYGDFFDFISKHRKHFDEKLARTFFRQLVDAVEYLHENGVAHLDLKPENLLIGADYKLKLADFDLSYVHGDPKILSRGTKYYRGPEFFKAPSGTEPNIKSTFAADIHSLGIIMFIFKSQGIYPHTEGSELEGVDLVNLMYNNNEEFWRKHCEIQEREQSYYEGEFRELFNAMVRCVPEERISLKEVKGSSWYNGPVYTESELQGKMKAILRS